MRSTIAALCTLLAAFPAWAQDPPAPPPEVTSVELQLPYGLYDRRHIRGAVTLRLGREGEEYAGIRKDAVHLAGRIALIDDDGPFGNPTSDSARTMVTPATTDGLVVVFAPLEVDRTRLSRVLDLTAERIALICGGREVGRTVG